MFSGITSPTSAITSHTTTTTPKPTTTKEKKNYLKLLIRTGIDSFTFFVPLWLKQNKKYLHAL